MWQTAPPKFMACFELVLPESSRSLFKAKKPKLGNIKIKFDGKHNGASKGTDCEAPKKARRRPAPLEGKARFLTELNDGRRHRTGDRFFNNIGL